MKKITFYNHISRGYIIVPNHEVETTLLRLSILNYKGEISYEQTN